MPAFFFRLTFSLCSLVDSQAAYVDAIAKVFKHAQCIGACDRLFSTLLVAPPRKTDHRERNRRAQTNTSPRSFKAPVHPTTTVRTISSIATCACTSSGTCAGAASSLVTLCAVSCCRMSASCSTSVGVCSRSSRYMVLRADYDPTRCRCQARRSLAFCRLDPQ